MHEAVMEYRRKLASLTPQNKHIWELAHTMMDEMARSEEAGMRDQWNICQRHGNASREAENELLELLATPASTGEPQKNHRWTLEHIDGGIRICEGHHERSSGCEWTEYVPKASTGEANGWTSVPHGLLMELRGMIVLEWTRTPLESDKAKYLHTLWTQIDAIRLPPAPTSVPQAEPPKKEMP